MVKRFLLGVFFVLLAASGLMAQAPLSDGACFYREENFRGRYFCIGAGETRDHLTDGFAAGIYSVKVFGNASVMVYNDPGFRGVYAQIPSSIGDLRQLRVSDNPSKHWAGRINSLRVEFRRARGPRGPRDDDDRRYPIDRPRRRPYPDNAAVPRDGVCFYRSENFRGRSFCVAVGDSLDRLYEGFDDGLYSLQVFGNAEAIVFNEPGFYGVNARIDESVQDLRQVPVADNPTKSWAGRISSIQVNFKRRGFRRGPQLRWGRERFPAAGACFYRDRDFRGDYFCMGVGESYDDLPPGFNDGISSIRVFGGAELAVFNYSDFRGINVRIRRDVADLSRWRTADNPYKNWGDRISSIQVWGRGWGDDNGWRPGR